MKPENSKITPSAPELPAQPGAASEVDPAGTNYFPADAIAEVAGLSPKTIHRLAKKEGWPVAFGKGIQLLYRPPERFRVGLTGAAEYAPAWGAISNPRRIDGLRASLKFSALCECDRLIQSGVGIEEALAAVESAFTFKCSISSLRRWQEAYANDGYPGLLDHRPGRSGRKESSG